MADTQNIRLKGKQWQFYRKIPRALQVAFQGRQTIIQNLETGDLLRAQQARDLLVRRTDIVFDRARKGLPLDLNAWSIRVDQAVEASEDQALVGDVQDVLERVVDGLERHDSQVANYSVHLTKRKATPLDEDLLVQFFIEEPCALSTQDKRKNTLNRFKKWLGPSQWTVEAVTKKVAGAYVTHMRQELNLLPASVNDHVTGLSSFWKWFGKKGINTSGENPWLGQSLSLRKHNSQLDSDAARNKVGWTPDEVQKLISETNDQFLRDVISMAALSGMRQKELCDLRIRNLAVLDGIQLFDITRGKTLAAIRKVPVHNQLQEIIRRRTFGKGPDEFLIHEVNREKALKYTEALSKRFTEHSRALFPEYSANKKRRQALKDFHSLRRYFITERHKTGCNPAVLPWVVGHGVEGMTFGVYSSGPSLQQRRECVEAVGLPFGPRP